jgi:hypothetical protein
MGSGTREIERHEDAVALVAVAVEIEALVRIRPALEGLEHGEAVPFGHRQGMGALLGVRAGHRHGDDQRAAVRRPGEADRAAPDAQHRRLRVRGPDHGVGPGDAPEEGRERSSLGREGVHRRVGAPGEGRHRHVEELAQARPLGHEVPEVERHEEVAGAVGGGEEAAAQAGLGEPVGGRQRHERREPVVGRRRARDEERVDPRGRHRRRAARDRDRDRTGEGAAVAGGADALVGVRETEAETERGRALARDRRQRRHLDGEPGARGGGEGDRDVVVGDVGGERAGADGDGIARAGEGCAHLAERRREATLGGGDDVAGGARLRRPDLGEDGDKNGCQSP